eukprot:5632394-Pyramimonas_sp.AAC.1
MPMRFSNARAQAAFASALSLEPARNPRGGYYLSGTLCVSSNGSHIGTDHRLPQNTSRGPKALEPLAS